MSKIHTLMEAEGVDDMDGFLAEFALREAVPGICMNPWCQEVFHYEPDQRRGWCDACETQSVKSGLILIGML